MSAGVGLLSLGLLLGRVASGAAQEPQAQGPRFRARFAADSIVLLPPEPWNQAARPLGFRAAPELVARRWGEEVRALWVTTLSRPWSADRLPALPAARTAEANREAPGASPLGDLELEVTSHLEMRLDRLRHARCSAADVNAASGCAAGFPTPTVDAQFRVRTSGIVSQRLNLNVDFDSQREFNVNNDIRLWYAAPEGEVVRRVELGNITFRGIPSQFITTGLPSNSFGLQVEAQTGRLELRGVFAQQQGSALRTRDFTIGDQTRQPVDVRIRDLDFESGRFFFVMDPRSLPEYPALDILDLPVERLPPSRRPVAVRVYRLRAQGPLGVENPNLGGVNAVALRPDSPQRVGPFTWQPLVEGRDYYLDPSGLWFWLTTRIGSEDFLAVSYISAAGDTVGTFPATNSGRDTLFLIHEPRRGPEVPTFFHEMRNVYRVGATDVDRNTIALTLLVNESEQPLNGDGTYLERLGLARETDPTALDTENRVYPRTRDPVAPEAVRDLFVVFPHLTPFADSARLAAGERNDSLYRTPVYLLATQGPPPRFSLQLVYEATGAGDRGSISLGALQVREGSEKLFLGERPLVRGRDYEMDYALGQVRFLNPDALFLGPATLRAQFQENQLFDPARQNTLGLAATYHFGSEARLHAVGLFQSDRSSFTRPALGLEPQSGFIGALRGEARLRSDGISGFLDRLPAVRVGGPTTLDINGEMALSRPNPNRFGVAYVEDFEQRAGFAVSLLEGKFSLGSAPLSGRGVPVTHWGAGAPFDPADAVPLVWQNRVLEANGILEFTPRQIDSSIVLTGAGVTGEPVLWLTLKADTVGGAPDPATGAPRWRLPHTPGPRWRAVVQPLGGGSGTGVDLSRVEFIEFWLLEDGAASARRADALLVIDLGTVLEDAPAFGPERFIVSGADTVFEGKRALGQGVLDTERDTVANVYSALTDDRGIHGDLLDSIVDVLTGTPVRGLALCDAGGGTGFRVFPRGDLRAVCTRRNARLDTEDLDGDNRLDITLTAPSENVMRFVVGIGDARYYVRDGVTHFDAAGRPMTWRLYRIPFRVDTLQIGTPNLRQVETLRLTVVVPDRGEEEDVSLALARLQFVGAPWLKRAETPIAGLAGRVGEPHGEVVASVISTEDRGLGYSSPPGVVDAADRREAVFEIAQQQINEKSLRVVATDLRPGERAEVLRRFTTEAEKNFLAYRRLRVWAQGRGAGWDEGELQFFVKVGQDENNFYLYRTPLRAGTWEPEIVLDLERWLALRTAVELNWLGGLAPSGAAACGGDTTAYVACDGPYLVHVADPGIAPPNLAQVSEIAVGILHVGAAALSGTAELWVDDIRLTDVVDKPGVAGALDLRLRAGELVDLALVHRSSNAHFRQLGDVPSYLAQRTTSVEARLGLQQLLPAGWGLSVPFVVRHTVSGADPLYLPRSDILAADLPDLRQQRASATAVEIAVRRSVRGERALERWLWDPLSLYARRESGSTVASLASARFTYRAAEVAYDARPDAVTVAGAPRFLVRLVEGLPRWLRESAFGRALRTSRLRLNPIQVRARSRLTDDETERLAYRVPVALARDTAVRSLSSAMHTWRNEVGIEFRPYQSFGFGASLASTRDLRDYGDSTVMGRLLGRERGELAGANIGFERSRTLNTRLDMAPPLASWLRPRFRYSGDFWFTRDPNRRDPVPVGGDSNELRLPETVANRRETELGVTVDVGRLAGGSAGDSSFLVRFAQRVLPIDLAWRRNLRSTFDRALFDPDLPYELALGGLHRFRERDGTPATFAGAGLVRTARGGLRLPGRGELRVSYRDQEETQWSRRGPEQSEVVMESREWPSASVNWWLQPGGAVGRVLTALSFSMQYRRLATSSRQQTPSETGAVHTSSFSRQVLPGLSLTWNGDLTTSVRLGWTDGELVTAGNRTDMRRTEWGGSAAFPFAMPQSLVRLRERLNATVAYSGSRAVVCLVTPGSEECRTVSDSRRDQVDVRVDTGFSQAVRGGLTFSYVVTDQRHTSDRLSQLVFAIFADINLFAVGLP